MEVIEALSQVSAKLSDRVFGQLLILLYQLVEVSAGAVLKNDPEVVARLVPVEKPEDVTVF